MRFLLAFLFCQICGAAESLKGDHVQIDWLAPKVFSENNETLIGIRFRTDPSWHVYWKNPGDSGAAPKFQIKAINAQASEILWPAPSRLPVAHLTNLGYKDETVYFFKVAANSQTPVELDVDLEWLVCKEECIPGFGQLNLSRPAKGTTSIFEPATQAKLKLHQEKLPSNGNVSDYSIQVNETTDGFIRAVVKSKANLPNFIDLFPTEPEYIQPAQPKISKTENSYEVIFQKSATASRPNNLGFLLIADGKAFEFLNLKIATLPATNEATSLAVLLVLLGSSLLGGILLNLMPCVFPVISIKVVSLLKTENPRERRRDGWLYTFGVLTTFAALGAGFLILRHLGSAIGWGFQLQSPLVVFGLIILFWLMALNFLGVFDFGTSIMNSAGRIRWQSSFGTGMLSVFVAAPCTGPFMGTALGATATMPGYQAMLVFLFLGLGLALPYLLLTMSPRLAKKLPRPGAWMETLKQFFAFPLFATVLWLLWVLGLQAGQQGWIASSIALFGISFALWIAKRKQKFWLVVAWLMAISTTLAAAQQIQEAQIPSAAATAEKSWQPYSEEKLSAALQKGQPVFVDFTAAWCITCQVNKKAVLETATADEIFKKAGILKLQADWTNQDPIVTEALYRLDRNSVPVYAFYNGKDSKPQLLPQILTMDMIRNLIPTKESQ